MCDNHRSDCGFRNLRLTKRRKSIVGVLMHTGSAPYSLAIWLACGLFSLCGALCYAELGTTIPKSGGDYAYIYEAFGKVPAFLFLWISLIIVNPTSIAVMALTFSSYILQPFYDGCEPSDFVTRILASSVIIILTIINCYSVRWSTRTQDVSTIAKLGALVVIILAGVVYVALGNVENLRIPKTNSIDLSLPQIALAFYQGVFSYSGWNYLNFVTEEIKEPYKNLPRAIYISLPVVTIIYMAVNCAYFAVLTPEEVLESPAVAFTFANRVLGPIKHLMPLFVAISCIGSVNGIIFTSSPRDGQLPELLAMISIRYMTPVPSLVILAVLSVLMLNFADVLVLINYLSFSESSVVAMSILALVKMRIYNPELPRPIRFHIAIPLVFLALCFYILVAPFVRQPYELFAAVLIIVSGVPAYLIFVSSEKRPTALYGLWIKFTHSLQKIFLCVTEETS
ncbi:Aat-2 [Aphelenchoides besseyi]|nr:Aat-2 [Aphelenchoides besseyi]